MGCHGQTCFDAVWLIGVNETRLTLLVLTVGISGVVRSMLGEQRSDIAVRSWLEFVA